jgi:hypothetical protein
MQCTNHVKQLSLALHNCHDVTGTFPSEVYPNADGTGDRQISCYMGLIWYIEQSNLTNLLHEKGVTVDTMTHQQTNVLTAHETSLFICPNTSYRKNKTGNNIGNNFIATYMANSGAAESEMTPASIYTWDLTNTSASGPRLTNGIIFYRSKIGFSNIIDGTSNTFAWSEISWNEFVGMTWARSSSSTLCYAKGFAENLPINLYKKGVDTTYNIKVTATATASGSIDINVDTDFEVTKQTTYGPWGSYHSGGVVAGLCDGSVRFVSDTTDMKSILMRLACRNDGETVSLP